LFHCLLALLFRTPDLSCLPFRKVSHSLAPAQRTSIRRREAKVLPEAHREHRLIALAAEFSGPHESRAE
jgi:hypothetical protein